MSTLMKIGVLCLWASFSTGALAEDWPGQSTGGLRFSVDQAAFKGSTGRTLIEFYVLFEAAQLQYVPERGKFVGEVDLSVAVVDSAGQPAGETTWTRHLSVKSLSTVSEGGILYKDLTGIQLDPGTYQAVVSIEDMFGDKSGEVSLPLTVPALGGDKLSASDLIIASSVAPAKKDSRFAKSGFDVVPNTNRIYLTGDTLNAYVELYNFSPGKDARSETFVLGYSFKDTNGVAVKSFPATRFRKPGVSAVKTLSAETAGLAPGRYLFEVEAFDSGSRQHVRKQRLVSLASKDGPAEQELTEDQLRNLGYYRAIQPLASKDDLKVYDQVKMDEQAQMKFLRQFWKKLDPTPGTDINERLIEHIRRMRHCDNTFSGRAGELGSETHRGRVYVQYGAPDDIERENSGATSKPYEVWHYGRYEFVFQDRNGLGHFELVHSTYPGELNNPMWRQSTF